MLPLQLAALLMVAVAGTTVVLVRDPLRMTIVNAVYALTLYPYVLLPTVAVVSTTVVITALKAFDIVWVMTGGNFNTDVVASQMIKQSFQFTQFGRGSALAVILLIAIIPVMVLNINRFRAQEALR